MCMGDVSGGRGRQLPADLGRRSSSKRSPPLPALCPPLTPAEKSSSAGFLLEDVFAFPDEKKDPVKVVFGCENDETGEIFKQMADGLIGMGNNNNAFHSQLVAQKVIADTFGLCFAYPTGGSMVLGEIYPL